MGRTFRRALVGFMSVFCVLSGPAFADDFGDRLRRMPAPSFTSQKSSAALEWCIGTGIGKWMTPSSLHGENTLVIFGTPVIGMGLAPVYMMVKVDDLGASRAISLNAHKAWDDKTAALIQSCI